MYDIINVIYQLQTMVMADICLGMKWFKYTFPGTEAFMNSDLEMEHTILTAPEPTLPM